MTTPLEVASKFLACPTAEQYGPNALKYAGTISQDTTTKVFKLLTKVRSQGHQEFVDG
jgi:hypothetical protein